MIPDTCKEIVLDALRIVVSSGHTVYIMADKYSTPYVTTQPIAYGSDRLVGYARTDGLVEYPQYGVLTIVDFDAAMGGS